MGIIPKTRPSTGGSDNTGAAADIMTINKNGAIIFLKIYSMIHTL